MNVELQAIKDGWEGPTRDLVATTAAADAYVAAHPEEFTGYQDQPMDSLVELLEAFRTAGQEDYQWLVQVWLWHRFEPQNIGGTYQPQIRNVTPSGE